MKRQINGDILRVVVSCMIAVFLISGWCSHILAYPYGVTVQVVEPTYADETQTNPDLNFSNTGDLHLVWSDIRDPIPFDYVHIFYRSAFGGAFSIPSERVDSIGSDESLDMPVIDFRSGTLIDVLYKQEVAAPYMRLTEYNGAVWTDVSGGPTQSPFAPMTDYAVAGEGDNLYMAYIVSNGIMVDQYDGNLWHAWEITAPGTEYAFNVDLCIDDAGFLYIVYDYVQVDIPYDHWTIVQRSNQVGDITAGFTWPREVIVPNMTNVPGQPSIDAMGSFAVGNLAVIIAYYGDTMGPSHIYCIAEGSVDWQNTSSQFWESGQLNIVTDMPVTAENPDIAIGNFEVHVVWADMRTAYNAIYADMSYNPFIPGSFYSDQLISKPGGDESPSPAHPRITAYPASDEIAIAYDLAETVDNCYLVWNAIGFTDDCSNPLFPGWTAHSGVDVDYNPPYRTGNPAYVFQISKRNRGGTLEQDYPEQNEGTIDYWFYDPFGEQGSEDPDEDFWVQIYGDNAAKISVYRMLGVRNAITDSTTYSFRVNTDAWQNTGRYRSHGWHHVSVIVEHDPPDQGIKIYLDPETETALLNDSGLDPNASEFTSFSNFLFESTATQVEYFIDDVVIDAEPVGGPSPDVPTLTPIGIIILMIGFLAFFFKRNRSR